MWWPSNVGSMGLPDNVAKTRMCVCVCVCVRRPDFVGTINNITTTRILSTFV